MKRYDLIVIGAGPAGLSAAIRAARFGAKTAVFDENSRPGGQLFKQIHKFFGSTEQHAKMRGFNIGRELLSEAEALGVVIHLNSIVMGIYENKEILVNENGLTEHYKADVILAATGAMENMIPFEGWTLPGVMGAGAAQTLMNLHGVQAGSRVLIVGSGNVGLVVAYQLKQAGMDVAAIIDAAPRVGGYGVHAAKVARTGVPFYTSHTIVRAEGTDRVTGVVIARLDSAFRPVPGTEKHLDVDLVLMAIGLNPMSQLTSMIKCSSEDRGGMFPRVDEYGETSVSGIYAAGDVAGIEESSSAMLNGGITGTAIARRLGYIDRARMEAEIAPLRAALDELRSGMFGLYNRGKTYTRTDEGYELSASLLKNGYVADDEIDRFPGVTHVQGPHPVIECTQNIPCDPCRNACPFGCIEIDGSITHLPRFDTDRRCAACGMCVASCSGQAIFLVDEDAGDGWATVTLPYEFLPYPKVGDRGRALGRSGEPVCEAEVVGFKTSPAYDKTALLTMRVPKDMAMKARFFRGEEN